MSVSEVQSQPVHKPMVLYVPEKDKLLNKSSVTVWEGKHFQNYNYHIFE
jgi:hypothetical protein